MKAIILILTILTVAGCAQICKIPGLNQLPGVTCPTPAPSPGQ